MGTGDEDSLNKNLSHKMINEIKRRGFLKGSISIVLGAVLLLAPLITGLLFFLDPLRRKTQTQGFLKVGSLDSLPLRIPRITKVRGNKINAWNKHANEPIGAIYLVRYEEKVRAFQAICPHAGCFVDYSHTQKGFLCPCHKSSFDLDGSRTSLSSPSPRGMDSLEVRVEGNDILVRYEEFQQGNSEKILIS